jgi:fructose-bisphosphate aldolase class I
MNTEQLKKVEAGRGFVAALDQSGGSTPKALKLYGIDDSAYSGESEMFDLIHEMRTRIITSRAFNGDRILGAILFEMTMDREIEGVGSGEYLWDTKGVVPFLKVDQGLAEEDHGAQVMKPIPGLDDLLSRAIDRGMFGTKMRSVVKVADDKGIASVLDQQFEIGRSIRATGLVPILEPEIDIHSPSKAEAEDKLLEGVLERLDDLGDDERIMLKLTLPEADGHYQPLVDHPKVVKVLALSGGYSRDEADARLARNPGVIASFSRALTEGLTAQQTDAEFDGTLDAAIESIYQASVA